MTEKLPSYSVLMSVYFKEKKDWLIQSIESMLNQTVLTDDFVLVKDGKLTDELKKLYLNIVKNIQIYFIL